MLPKKSTLPKSPSRAQRADRGTGKVMAISLWETEADLRANEPSSATDPLSKGAPVREVYQVGVEAQARFCYSASGGLQSVSKRYR